ncbi:MAG: hypothetical protein K6G50_02510 [bacterium]|nr:hypothetical protein [bacterium]
MKALRNLACAAVMATVMLASAGVATAEETIVNNTMAPGVWYCNWVGPTNLEFGAPDQGVMWQNDFSGEVRFIDDKYMSVSLDESGDIANFYLYPEITEYTPSFEGVRVGSKVQVRADDRHRARWIKTTPFYQWLKEQAE